MNDAALPATTRATALTPTTYQEAVHFAQIMAKSSMVPADYRGKPENILLALQLGAELGLAPLQAIQSIATINGKPAVYGDAALALVRASPLCDDVLETFEGEGEDRAAVCIAKRRGKAPVTGRFSVSEAKRAGLWGKAGPWQSYPRRMLQMRARSFALRDAFPDVLRGLIVAEEAQDYRREPMDITPHDTRADLDAFAGIAPQPETSESPAEPPPSAPHPPGNAALSEPAGDTADDRPSLFIEVPLKGNKQDLKTWAAGLFRPKLRRQTSPSQLAYLLGDNEAALIACRGGGLSSGDLADLEDDIKAAWEQCE